jgi:hypothetical protein
MIVTLAILIYPQPFIELASRSAHMLVRM